MRWFKHMTRSWDDEKISELVENCGLEGYGFYFRLLEIVSANIEESSDSSVTYSLRKWSKLTAIFQPKVIRLCQVCADLDLIEFKIYEKLLKVSIPKILKYRDEYSEKKAKQKRKNRDKLPTISRQTPEQETDTETDTETELDIEEEEANFSPSKTPREQKVAFEKLNNALGKLQCSPEEIELCQQLLAVGCSYEDIEKARLQTGKNSLKYLQNIVCELRDKRNGNGKFDAMEFLKTL